MFRSQDHLQGATLFLAKVTLKKNTHRLTMKIVLYIFLNMVYLGR